MFQKSVTLFLLIVVLKYDLRVLFLECKNREDNLKMPYRVSDVKKIIQLCNNKKSCDNNENTQIEKCIPVKKLSILK